MTIHKLTAGAGDTYLTRQVASVDTRRGGQDLAVCYTATGTPPRRWTSAGAADLGVRGQVSELQMKALYGKGWHPDADAIVAALTVAGATVTEARGHARLGRPFLGFARLPELNARLADRAQAHITQTGARPSPRVIEGGRAEEAARQRRAVAGYDVVFSPVKSISLLWALGDQRVRNAVEAPAAVVTSRASWWPSRTATGDRAHRARPCGPARRRRRFASPAASPGAQPRGCLN